MKKMETRPQGSLQKELKKRSDDLLKELQKHGNWKRKHANEIYLEIPCIDCGEKSKTYNLTSSVKFSNQEIDEIIARSKESWHCEDCKKKLAEAA